MEKIKSSFKQKKDLIPLDKICDKIVYPNKNDAKIDLREINGTKQEHKKPIRAYKSLKCSCWHLTSLLT